MKTCVAKFASFAAVLLASAANSSACAVCMGSDDKQIAYASNTVLWWLLGLVGFIFLSTGLTAWFLWRKAFATHKSDPVSAAVPNGLPTHS